ncbi:MAG: hypothetical protein P8L85_21315 [Rubripirellula sp.]|nr:hypothetical protein [Rubripirellula sp.]
MSKCLAWLCGVLMVVANGFDEIRAEGPSEVSQQKTSELDAYWIRVSQSVGEGDFAGYSATCHPLGVLVSGVKQTSYPLTEALAKWKEGFEDTRAKRMKASVEFRFSQRLHDATTAHETGIFRYATSRDGESSISYIHFEGLLHKSEAGWQIMMEYQKSIATEAEWMALETKRAPGK